MLVQDGRSSQRTSTNPCCGPWWQKALWPCRWWLMAGRCMSVASIATARRMPCLDWKWETEPSSQFEETSHEAWVFYLGFKLFFCSPLFLFVFRFLLWLFFLFRHGDVFRGARVPGSCEFPRSSIMPWPWSPMAKTRWATWWAMKTTVTVCQQEMPCLMADGPWLENRKMWEKGQLNWSQDLKKKYWTILNSWGDSFGRWVGRGKVRCLETNMKIIYSSWNCQTFEVV